MKNTLLLLLMFAFTASAHAQGTLYFSATLTGAQQVPPNNSPDTGTASLWLNGNTLEYRVWVPIAPTSASISGPAAPGEQAGVVFDLGGFAVVPGSLSGDTPTGYGSMSPSIPPFGAGPFTLSEQQIDQLASGLWYINVASYGLPDGQLRGQILPVVPEPTLLPLLSLAIGLGWLLRSARTKERV